MKKNLLITALAVFMLAGCQALAPVETPSESGAPTDAQEMYINDELGFQFAIPENWKNLDVDIEESPEQVTFYADFDDWKDYAITTIGRTPKGEWQTCETDEQIAEGTCNPYAKKIAETDEYVYWQVTVAQDSPAVIEGPASPYHPVVEITQ
jgi:hypothetical protein